MFYILCGARLIFYAQMFDTQAQIAALKAAGYEVDRSRASGCRWERPECIGC
jgi:hypothetical protein